MPMDKDILSVAEFARQVKYSDRHIRQLCIDGKISGARKLTEGSRKWLIPVSALKDFREGTSETSQKETQPSDRKNQHHNLTIESEYTVHEIQEARRHDSSNFESADALLPEQVVRKYLSDLMTPPYTYHDSDTMKLAKFFDYFNLEGNKYVIPEVQQACERLLNDLDDIVKFMVPYFYTESRPRLQNGGYIVRFDLGGRYDQDNPEHKRIGQAIEEKAKRAYESYIDYRATVKRILFI